MKICIDPGHNANPDSGAAHYIIEDDATKAVASALIVKLQDLGHQVKSTLPIRNISSVGQSLNRRVQVANDMDADLFISVHFNAANVTEKPRGTEAWVASDAGAHWAAKILPEITKLGFVNRGVKRTTNLVVVRDTNCPAVLLEVCFVDSLADVDLYKKIGPEAIAQAIAGAISPASLPKTAESPATVLAKPSSQTVGDILAAQGGSTAPLYGLNQQLIVTAAKYGLGLVPTDSAALVAADRSVNLAFAPRLAEDLIAIARAAGGKIRINSAYRTAAQQYLLRKWFEKGVDGIPLAARVGTSNHEGGCAVDVDGWETLKPYFLKKGWVHQLDKTGSDPVHFERPVGAADRRLGVKAIQLLWNEHNPTDKITVDGDFGPTTESKLLLMPVGGY
jgi:N-acetylmuramoyl-L-alanine amidase